MSNDERNNDRPEVIAPGAIESIERAQIDMQIATAKRYPRDIAKVKRDIESMATLDQETAESCFYNLPRGGKNIQGPGVRLAEIAVHSFGNVRVQTRVIDTDTGKNAHVTVQAVCADLEKNVAVSIEKRRRIVGKKSKGGVIDEDDINLAVNACAAIAFRDAAFKVVPGALVKPAFDAAKRVAIGDAKTLATRRMDALAKLAKMGVDTPRVLLALNKTHADNIDLSDLETLFGLFTAIKDGQTTIEAAFPTAQAAADASKSRAEQLAEKAKAAQKPAEDKPATEPARERQPGEDDDLPFPK